MFSQCHTHQKVKDTTKRRREVVQARAPKGSKGSTIKSESREETPFSVESGLPPLNKAGEVEGDSQDGTGPGTFLGIS